MFQNRKSIRLKHYDYAQTGAYFVTICTHNRVCIFGEIVGENMQFTALGLMVGEAWRAIPQHYPQVFLDEFVVMPNHIHGVLMIQNNAVGLDGSVNVEGAINLEGSMNRTPTLGEVVRAFKARVSRAAKLQFNVQLPLWQRNYYEHVLRGDKTLHATREYIANNPLQWHLDKENLYA